MCNEKKDIKEIPVMYKIIGERLSISKDPWGMINHRDIQICLGRLFHTPKCHTNKIIEELIQFGFIEKMGRNQVCVFYKVN